MKISTFTSILLITGVLIFIFGLMAQEGENRFGTDINKSNWEGKYDYSTNINTSITPLMTSFEQIQDEDVGWFTKLTAGISAIPRAIMLIPTLLVDTFGMATNLIVGIFTSFKLPQYLISVAIVMLVVWGLFKLIGVFNRWQA